MFFGSESKNPDECEEDNRAGALLFFDAIPVNKVQLTTDIMTPHYGKWYEQGGSEQAGQADTLPGDWHSPVPVPFLVCKKASFLFGLAPREGCTIAPELFNQAMSWLEEALMFWGVGAKTATGYGHMDRDSDGIEKSLRDDLLEQAAEQAVAQAELARLAVMSPEEKAIDALDKRMGRGEDEGMGAGSSLGSDLYRLFSEAISAEWERRHIESLITLGKELYKHLGINLKKNKKAKMRIRELENMLP